MAPEIVALAGLGVLVGLLLFGVWIGSAMILVGFLGYAVLMGFGPAIKVIAQIPFSTVSYYPLTVVPCFIFMGLILFHSGIGEDLYFAAYKTIGDLRGGLAMATVAACALFAAITGVPAPSAVTMAKVALPEMRKYGYNDSLATGCIASASTLAILIPPSISFVIYGIITENSIGKLFIAGVVPGALLSIIFMLIIWIISLVRPEYAPRGPKTKLNEKIRAMRLVWPTLILFLGVLGGIYAGIFTPTEGGAVGACSVLLIAGCMRRLDYKKVWIALVETAETTAMIFFLIVGAYVMMKFFAVSKLAFFISKAVVQLNLSKWMVFVGIVVLYLICGMFLEITSAIILTIPIVYPLILEMGFDPLWFGVIVVLLIQIGLITPPVGLDVFIVSGASGVPLPVIFKGIIPFFIGLIICITILALWPDLAIILPRSM